MYKLRYDYIEKKYGNKSGLLFSYTDSLVYEIKTENVYEDFSQDKEMFKFNNYSAKSKYYDDSNKLLVGEMKDKTAGAAIEIFIGLKPMI